MTQETAREDAPAVRTTVDDARGVGTVVLDNPAQRNALSTVVMRATTEALRELAQAPAVRVVVLAATAGAVAPAIRAARLDPVSILRVP